MYGWGINDFEYGWINKSPQSPPYTWANALWFDWTTDTCSAPVFGDTGYSYDFKLSCIRHDFGYRNYKLLDRRYNCNNPNEFGLCDPQGNFGRYWNSSNRHKIDDNFLRDMRDHCAGRSHLLKPSCYSNAQIYYEAVRLFGGP